MSKSELKSEETSFTSTENELWMYADGFHFPLEILLHIFDYLDGTSLFLNCTRVCKLWNFLISDERFFKQLCLRDFGDYVKSEPMGYEASRLKFEYEGGILPPNSKTLRQFRSLEKICLSLGPEAEITSTPHFEGAEDLALYDGYYSGQESGDDADPNMDQEDSEEVEEMVQPQKKAHKREPKIPMGSWTQLYKLCKKRENNGTSDLSGYYSANYGVHGEEIVYIQHKGYSLFGKKIVGDRNVPTGKPTFDIHLLEDQVHGRGAQHLADVGYQNPRWGRATLLVVNRSKLIVRWHFLFPAFSSNPRWYTKTLHFNRLEGYQEAPPVSP